MLDFIGRPALWSLLVLVLVSAAGCSDAAGVAACQDDHSCQDTTHPSYDPSAPRCLLPEGRCYPGCSSDAACRDTSVWWHKADRLRCNLASGHCVSGPGVDARPEAAVDAGDMGVDAWDVMPPADTCLAQGSKCGGDVLCCTGYCADGYCCDKACGGTCESCKLSGTEGTCTAVASGSDPDSECTGDTGCGPGVCDGKGACDFSSMKDKVCQSSCLQGKETVSKCDAKGKCVQVVKDRDCKPYKCDAVNQVCYQGCSATHAECVTDSVCDRTQAHTASAAGQGVCVDQSTYAVVTVYPTGGTKPVSQGIGKITTNKGYLRLKAGTFTEDIQVTTGEVVFVADGAVIIDPLSTTANGISIAAGAKAVLQGVTIKSSDKTGVACEGTSSNISSLGIYDSTISDNKELGVLASNCDVTMRRSKVQSNDAGGVKLADGTFVLVNNLLTDNGGTKSTVGGVSLSPTKSANSTFVNNTVADNSNGTGVGIGVVCSLTAPTTLYNSILWNANLPTSYTQQGGCKLAYSDVQGETATGTVLAKDPKFADSKNGNYTLVSSGTGISPCIDVGDKSQVDTVLDLAGKTRVQGTGVDMGAYEAK